MNILLIRLRLIGDVVFTTPAIGAIKRELPQARLTYVVESAAAPVVTNNPHVDRVVVLPRRRGLGRITDDIAATRMLRRGRFDVAIDFHGGPRASWLTLASGAPRRIGYSSRTGRWPYTQCVERARELRARHSVENQWDLLAPLDERFRRNPDPRREPVMMAVDPAADGAVRRRLAGAGVTPRHLLIILHVSAGNPFRRWPRESFVDLAVGLAAGDPCRRIVLTAGPSDGASAGSIELAAKRRLGPGRQNAIVAGEELDLHELHALIAQAALFIGGDSGPLHVAATTSTPIVGIYGPTLPARSAPWRDPDLVTEAVELLDLPCRPCEQRRCEPGDFRCLGWIDPDVVLAAAERALNRSR